MFKSLLSEFLSFWKSHLFPKEIFSPFSHPVPFMVLFESITSSITILQERILKKNKTRRHSRWFFYLDIKWKIPSQTLIFSVKGNGPSKTKFFQLSDFGTIIKKFHFFCLNFLNFSFQKFLKIKNFAKTFLNFSDQVNDLNWALSLKTRFCSREFSRNLFKIFHSKTKSEE